MLSFNCLCFFACSESSAISNWNFNFWPASRAYCLIYSVSHQYRTLVETFYRICRNLYQAQKRTRIWCVACRIWSIVIQALVFFVSNEKKNILLLRNSAVPLRRAWRFDYLQRVCSLFVVLVVVVVYGMICLVLFFICR